jgi:hypothetical protein
MCISITGYAQITQGTIRYAVDYSNAENLDSQTNDAVKSSGVTLSFDANFLRFERSIPDILNETIIIDKQKDSVLRLSQTLSNKTFFQMTIAEMQENTDMNGNSVELFLSNQKKEILGYQCEEVTMIFTDFPGMEIIYWSTNDIDVGVAGYEVPSEIPGTVLKTIIRANGMEVTTTATEIILEKPNTNLFALTIPDGYRDPTLLHINIDRPENGSRLGNDSIPPPPPPSFQEEDDE